MILFNVSATGSASSTADVWISPPEPPPPPPPCTILDSSYLRLTRSHGKRGDGRKSSLPDACCVMFSSWT
ncbi:hypothetical protein KCU99_g296, partial [Aureobasidium melanogenum]